MIKYETIFKSEMLSVVLITTEYSSAYSNKDFNIYPAISFPLLSCFNYGVGKTNFLLDTNHILFEKKETEFNVSKYSFFSKDITLSIQFLKPDSTLDQYLSINNLQVLLQKRRVETEIVLRRFMSIASNADETYKEQLLIELINSLSIDDQPSIRSAYHSLHNIKKIDNSKNFIHANFYENISITKIASEVCLSPYYFSRIFKQLTGYSPYDYLLLTRIENAKLLLSKGASVTQTAFSSGFNSLDNFSYAFDRIVGLSPLLYKKSKISKI